MAHMANMNVGGLAVAMSRTRPLRANKSGLKHANAKSGKHSKKASRQRQDNADRRRANAGCDAGGSLAMLRRRQCRRLGNMGGLCMNISLFSAADHYIYEAAGFYALPLHNEAAQYIEKREAQLGCRHLNNICHAFPPKNIVHYV